MTKEQIFAFLKAPFSKSFLIAYAACLFVLLATPLFSTLMQLLFANLETINRLPEKEVSTFIANLLMENVQIADVLLAAVGLFLSWLLLSSYSLLLVHKTVTNSKTVFDAEKTPLTLFEVLGTLPKFLGLIFLIPLVVIIPMALFSLLMVLFAALNFPAILIALIAIIIGLYLLYRIIAYITTFSLFFYKEFHLTDCFRYRKVQNFFVSNKKTIFLSWLLFFVINQISSTLLFSIGSNLFNHVLVTGTLVSTFAWTNTLIVIIGILIGSLAVAYLTLLQATVNGKVIFWAWTKAEKKKVKHDVAPKRASKA